MLHEFADNFLHNLFKPLLLFFYAGFAIPLLGVKFEFPKVLYQGLTLYLLLAIGWHGGEELAGLEPAMYGQAAGFMLLGFVTNCIIGVLSFFMLRTFTRLRQVDAATVAGYYGSDSAGTFVTCLGVLTAANIAFAPYMPVMLAIMEIPGCFVALIIVARLRRRGMDVHGNMPGEANYQADSATTIRRALRPAETSEDDLDTELEETLETAAVGVGRELEVAYAANGGVSYSSRTTLRRSGSGVTGRGGRQGGFNGDGDAGDDDSKATEQEILSKQLEAEDEIALQNVGQVNPEKAHRQKHAFGPELLHEVFLNPGIYLLFAGIAIGFVSRLQGVKVIVANDHVFVDLFQGLLCLFLLEMGMTAARKLKDLRSGGWQFVAFGLIAPNIFATLGMLAAHAYSMAVGVQLELGTYVLFAVLCGAASYIALPAVQRLAIPEASPTLPLAASLGLTFSYNVTIGIPVYMMIAKALIS